LPSFPWDGRPTNRRTRGRVSSERTAPVERYPNGCLKGSRRRLGCVRRRSKAAPSTRGLWGTRSNMDVDPSGGSKWEGQHRVGRGQLSEEQGSVRVTTANDCFSAKRPTETTPARLRLEDRVAGAHGSSIVDTTKPSHVNTDLTTGTVASRADFCPKAHRGVAFPSG
jgi:hypothetical protein